MDSDVDRYVGQIIYNPNVKSCKKCGVRPYICDSFIYRNDNFIKTVKYFGHYVEYEIYCPCCGRRAHQRISYRKYILDESKCKYFDKLIKKWNRRNT